MAEIDSLFEPSPPHRLSIIMTQRIADVRKTISLSIAEHLLVEGFETIHSPVFHKRVPQCIQVLSLNFLSTQDAHRFSSNTASFAVELGVYFLFPDTVHQEVPAPWHCQFRSTVLRKSFERSPSTDFDLLHPETWRRDIWWIKPQGQNLDQLLMNVKTLIRNQAIPWLNKFSNPAHCLRCLKNTKEANGAIFKSGPWGFGAKGSPARTKLIHMMETIL